MPLCPLMRYIAWPTKDRVSDELSPTFLKASLVDGPNQYRTSPLRPLFRHHRIASHQGGHPALGHNTEKLWYSCSSWATN